MIKCLISNIDDFNEDDMKAYFLKKCSGEAKSRYMAALNKKKGKAIVLGNCILKYIAGEYLNVKENQVKISKQKGKPILLNEKNIHLTLSHYDNYVLAAISDSVIGCDVQKNKRFVKEAMKPFFSKDDYEFILNAENQDKRLSLIWTRRECFVKIFQQFENLEDISFSHEKLLKEKYMLNYTSCSIEEDTIATVATYKSWEKVTFDKLKIDSFISYYK